MSPGRLFGAKVVTSNLLVAVPDKHISPSARLEAERAHCTTSATTRSSRLPDTQSTPLRHLQPVTLHQALSQTGPRRVEDAAAPFPRNRSTTFDEERSCRKSCSSMQGVNTAAAMRPILPGPFRSVTVASILSKGEQCMRSCSRCKRCVSRFTMKATLLMALRALEQAAEAICKAGAHWDDLHLLCHKVLCEEFIALGIFNGTVDELLESGLSQAFFPHGLGEYPSPMRCDCGARAHPLVLHQGIR